jgi:subtilisin family serine protease
MGLYKGVSVIVVFLLLLTTISAQLSDVQYRHELLTEKLHFAQEKNQALQDEPLKIQEQISVQAKSAQLREIETPKRYLITLTNANELTTNDAERELLQKAIFESSQTRIPNIKQKLEDHHLISAELTQSEYQKLLNNPLIHSIEEEEIYTLQLTQSTTVINATTVWQEQIENQNLTGLGQSVCIIDTGINYSHTDLGGCSQMYVQTANETIAVDIKSPNYPSNYTNNLLYYAGNVQVENADTIQLFFTLLDVELMYDFVKIYDDDGNLLDLLTGTQTNFWREFETNSVHIYLDSDITVTGQGFAITQARGFTYENQCAKIPAGHNFVEGNKNPMDYDGHGTHVAGTVAANGASKGVAPGSNLIAVKALDDVGEGFVTDIVAGIYYCANLPQNYNVSVISMSLGGSTNYSTYCDNTNSGNALYAAAINYAVGKNISVVVATGNTNSHQYIKSPACIQNATRVTSSTKADAISHFSDRNALVNLIAPGTNINATRHTSNGYQILSGTSMATPHVAGALAILNQLTTLAQIQKTPKQLELLLNQTGKPIYDASSNRNYSRINVGLATSQLISELGFNDIDITIISPQSNITTNNKIQLINITTTGLNVDTIWFNYNGTNTTYTQSVEVNLDDGDYTLYAWVNTSLGTTAQANVTFTINTSSPLITIGSPINQIYNQSNGTTLLNITTNGHDQIWFNYNGTNITYENPINITATQTPTTLFVWANNSLGTIGTANVTFEIDVTKNTTPSIIDNTVSPQQISETDEYRIQATLQGQTVFSLNNESVTRNITQYNVTIFFEDSLVYSYNVSDITNSQFKIDIQANLNDYVTENITNFTLRIDAKDELDNENYLQTTFQVLNMTFTNDTILATNQSQEINQSISQIIVPKNIPINITYVNQSSTNQSQVSPKLNMTFLDFALNNDTQQKTVTLSQIRLNLFEDAILLQISNNTSLTTNASWNRLFEFPTIQNTSQFTLSQANLDKVIGVGSQTNQLNFSQPILLQIQNAQNKKVAWASEQGTLTKINTICNAAQNPSNINQTTQECYIGVGNDIYIWTYHLTYFATYTDVQPSSNNAPSGGGPSGGGGGGGGMGSAVAAPSYSIYLANLTQVSEKRYSQDYNLTVRGTIRVFDNMRGDELDSNNASYIIRLDSHSLQDAKISVLNVNANTSISYTLTNMTSIEFTTAQNTNVKMSADEIALRFVRLRVELDFANHNYVIAQQEEQNQTQDELNEQQTVLDETKNLENQTVLSTTIINTDEQQTLSPEFILLVMVLSSIIGCIMFLVIVKQ